ncbi:hypothetical protein BH10PSE2_BH10PSE2_04230 [soil metagenome]
MGAVYLMTVAFGDRTMPLRSTALLTHRAVAILAVSLVAGQLSACGRPDAAERPAPRRTAPADPSLAKADPPVLAPLPASEYFETLTEQALTATPAELDVLIAQAKSASARDAHRLGPDAEAELMSRVREIAKAREVMTRADLAISSIEAFRLFVSAGSGADRVPIQVSLLDYAGFRYAIDVSTTPVRWDDAALAADVAEAQWDAIDSRVTDVGLRGRFGAAVLTLRSVARARDGNRAGRAAQAELDLVDSLETYFQGSAR